MYDFPAVGKFDYQPKLVISINSSADKLHIASTHLVYLTKVLNQEEQDKD